MRHLLLYLSLSIFILTSACSSVSPKTDSTPPDLEYPRPGYPEPVENYPYPYPYPFSAYASPTSPYPQPLTTESKYFATLGPVPTPGADWGIVIGRLFSNRNPVINATLYLAELAKDDKGTETIASYSPSSSPWAFTDENGRFTFSNIKPGRYSLVLDLAIDAFLLNKPGKNESFTLTVEPGKITDLGDLYFTDLPKPP